MESYFAGYAWLPGGLTRDVRIVVDGSHFAEVVSGSAARPGDQRLDGLVLPGLANTHSHAFHRALRGRTSDDTGSFWTWRDRMYDVAARLDPDRYYRLARAVYAEMALSGVTGVGEFHYLHHQAQGRRYADVNAMGEALIRAAADAGIRLTLLDTCYLAGGLSASGPLPIDEVQRRFSDGNAADWAERVSTLRGHTSARDDVRIGGAIHSVRAVPVAELPRVVAGTVGAPLHVHLSEQPAENEQCRAAYGCTPTELLDGAGALGPDSTAVHATHLGDSDIAILGTTGTSISVCPTTERDLADGIGPARQLLRAGSPLTLGTDQHALIDMFEEARALEMHERIATRRRGRFSPQEIVNCLTKDGHRAIGWDDVGAIAVGLRADLVAVGLGSVRTAGTDPGQALLAVGAADVEFVMRDGRVIVTDGHHILGDIGVLLEQEISAIWRDG